MAGAVKVEASKPAADTGLSATGPSTGSGSSGGSGANGSGGSDCSKGGGSTSVLVETVKYPNTCALPVAPGAQPSSSCEDDCWRVVCLERHRCQALLPCGHIVMCCPAARRPGTR